MYACQVTLLVHFGRIQDRLLRASQLQLDVLADVVHILRLVCLLDDFSHGRQELREFSFILEGDGLGTLLVDELDHSA